MVKLQQYPHIQRSRCPNVQISRYPNVKIYKNPETQKDQDIKMSRCQDIKISIYQNIKISRYQNSKISRYQDMKNKHMSKYQHINISKYKLHRWLEPLPCLVLRLHSPVAWARCLQPSDCHCPSELCTTDSRVLALGFNLNLLPTGWYNRRIHGNLSIPQNWPRLSGKECSLKLRRRWAADVSESAYSDFVT